MKVVAGSTGKEEEESVFRAAELYREWGIWLTHLRYTAAIEAFQKAVKYGKGDDLQNLLGLCNVQAEYARFLDAEKTSAECVKIDPHNFRAQHMRIQSLFKVGEFGYSLIYAHQALRHRRMPFEWSVYQNNEIFHDSIGRNASPQSLRLLYPWIRKLMDHRKDLIARKDEETNELDDVDEKDNANIKMHSILAQRKAYLTNLQSTLAKMYLDHLAIDKDFVGKILDKPAVLSCPNKKSTDELRHYVLRTYQRSIFRQDLLRNRKPLYVNLFKRMKIPVGHKMALKKEKQLLTSTFVIEVDFLLNKLHAARMRRDYLLFFNCLERTRHKIENYSKKMFPMKKKCLKALNRVTALVYLDTRNLMCLEDDDLKTVYVKHHLGLHVGLLPRDSDLAWITSTDPQESLRVIRRRISVASEPLDLAWLYHDLAKLFMEMGRLDLANFHAKKAHGMATEAKCEPWALNACHLMIRLEVRWENRNEAKEAALMALSSAKKLAVDYLVDFYERTIRVIEDFDHEKLGNVREIIARQRTIVDLMPSQMKTEVDYLWRNMDSLPASRTFSIVPGFKPIDRNPEFLSKRRSAFPSSSKENRSKSALALADRNATLSRIPGFIDFEEYE